MKTCKRKPTTDAQALKVLKVNIPSIFCDVSECISPQNSPFRFCTSHLAEYWKVCYFSSIMRKVCAGVSPFVLTHHAFYLDHIYGEGNWQKNENL